jgi:hypothetical protein
MIVVNVPRAFFEYYLFHTTPVMFDISPLSLSGVLQISLKEMVYVVPSVEWVFSCLVQ